MDKDTAREYLTDPQGRKSSEIGEAVDVLRANYRSYQEMGPRLPEIGGKNFGGETSYLSTSNRHSMED